jgi:hypothetical protein
MGPPKESLEKKNIFAEKYDEIRRLDGTLSYIQYITKLVHFPEPHIQLISTVCRT